MFMLAGLKDGVSWGRSPCLCQQAGWLRPRRCSRLGVFVVYVLYVHFVSGIFEAVLYKHFVSGFFEQFFDLQVALVLGIPWAQVFQHHRRGIA